MLTEAQIKKLVVVRLFKLQGCKDRNYLWHHIGVIRGLLWSLTDRDQGDLTDTDDILAVMGVPFEKNPTTGEVVVSQEWLDEYKVKV